VEDRAGPGTVNIGIAIVVPIIKVIEVIDQPAIRRLEDEIEREHRALNSAVPESAQFRISTNEVP
jgi:hypothetical protein